MSLDGISWSKKSEFAIKCGVFGVGGGGNNIVNSLISNGFLGKNVTPWVANTDNQVLQNSLCTNRIQLGPDVTRGWGAGGDPEVGRQAVIASRSTLEKCFNGLDMVLVIMTGGGGTGSLGGVETAAIAKACGLLVIAIYIMPFHFEGKKRRQIAEQGWNELKEHANTYIQIDNERLMTMLSDSNSKSFSYVDALHTVNSCVETIIYYLLLVVCICGTINVDFADLYSITRNGGLATVGVGVAEGDNAGLRATETAIQHPLLHCDIRGAKGAIIYFSGGPDMSLSDVNEGADYIRERIAPEANLHIGSHVDPSISDRISVVVIATGICPPPKAGATFKSVHQRGDGTPKMVFAGKDSTDRDEDGKFKDDREEYHWWQRIRKRWFSS